MTLQRNLDPLEMRLRGDGATHAVRYEGAIDEQAMRRAFRLLCVRFPVLRARIVPDGDGYLLQVPTDHFPDVAVYTGGEDELERQARSPWDPSVAVAQLLIFRSSGRGFVALRLDHAIVDARGLAAIQHALWKLYADIVQGLDVPMESAGSLPTSPSSLLRERTGSAAPSAGTPHHSVRPKLYDVHSRRIVLTRESTSRLISAAKAENTSVHALVCGVLLVVSRNRSAVEGPARMACLSIVDLRDRITPPVGATETTSMLGLHWAAIDLPPSGDPVSAGRQVKAQLDEAIRERNVPLYGLQEPTFADTDTALEAHLAVLRVTNSGVTQAFAQPPGLTITDLWKPLLTKMEVPYPNYGVYTYAGEFHMRCFYQAALFTAAEVDDMARQISLELRSVGESVVST